jgi:predicted nucleotidyltransferase
MTDIKIISSFKAAVQHACPGCEIYFFGSLVKGKHAKDSDKHAGVIAIFDREYVKAGVFLIVASTIRNVLNSLPCPQKSQYVNIFTLPNLIVKVYY